ncbi:MAG TPA: hypothetical protein DEU72_00120 [Desulfomicrobiaceae bacterium]|nr:hypothetical protein [Desulfomicrobiaceae bacterium]
MRSLIFLLLVACGLGAAWWWWTQRPQTPPPAPITEVAPQRWRVGNASEAVVSANATTASNATAANTSSENASANATNATNTTLAVADDPMLPRSLVRTLAQAVADRYHPGRTTQNLAGTGRLDLRIQSLGVRLADLPDVAVEKSDILQARQAVIAYALRPEVLGALERAYLPVFVNALKEALAGSTRTFLVDGAERVAPLSAAQRTEAMILMAKELRNLAQAIASLAQDQSHLPLVTAWHTKNQAVTTAQMQVWNVQVQGNMPALASATQAVDNALRQAAQARQRLVENLKRLPLSEDNSLYLAAWSARRAQHGMELSALLPLAETLRRAADAVESAAQSQ